ncbi:MetQ/NlpA family ABC transporter substrate-binding protein [Nicoliella spurrieriana]|uniref:MetQ/NlpA family ABC transporter substrate-binding protein n=1 Tax=Nicoliella spurrieriana TaxID=2925830 RepID=A0A976RT92_9LACO|nr:MetQ/NlpA family ABC transporter substrate-binding protein [Nicoliella spurrieriana]UQS87264.1 MetQ/NlpA family ABC transporter substrate-binding protein [Nicoliella spurrieriana]
MIKIGIIDTDVKLWQPTVNKLRRQGIDLELTQFNSYGQPNNSLFNNEININSFQSQAFLHAWNHTNHGNLVAIGKTYSAPMRIYSRKINELKQLKQGDTIVLPNDDANKARALRLLQSAGVLKLNHAKVPQVSDVIKNRHKFRFFTVDASQTVRDMSDATIGVVNDNFASAEHLNPKRALYSENTRELRDKRNINVIVVNQKDRHKAIYRKIVRAFQTTTNQKDLKTISSQDINPQW